MVKQIPHGTDSGYSYHKCRCPVCVAHKKAASAAYYALNRERVKARANAYYYDNHAEVRAKQSSKKASRTEAERAVAAEKRRAYMEQPEARAKQYARAKKYAQTDAGRLIHKAAAHRRRGVPFTDEALEYVPLLLADPCCYCGSPGGEVDHIVPVIDGGSGDWDNLTAACRSCNGRKWQRELLPFLLERMAA